MSEYVLATHNQQIIISDKRHTTVCKCLTNAVVGTIPLPCKYCLDTGRIVTVHNKTTENNILCMSCEGEGCDKCKDMTPLHFTGGC